VGTEQVVHLRDDAARLARGFALHDRLPGDAVLGRLVRPGDLGELERSRVRTVTWPPALTASATVVLTLSSSARVGRRRSASFWSKKRFP
jgi:hypothetical protein